MRGPDAIRVLHVDDDPAFTDLVGTFLEREDDRITVETATSPTEVLQHLNIAAFDCIVSDYEMPQQNGVEFLEAIRKRQADIPFILYTGKGSEEIASDAISAGVTDYLQKQTGTGQYTVLANRISNTVEQYRARKAVEDTEQKLTELAERTDDILFMFTADWEELMFINSAYEDIWGGSIDELYADSTAFIKLIHPADRDIARSTMRQLSKGEPANVEYRILRPDGEQRWVRGDTEPMIDEQGNVKRIVGQVRDITAEKERQLHHETILDNLPGYVYRHSIDHSYALQFVEGDSKAITGYTPAELEEDIGQAAIIHPEDQEALWAELETALADTGHFDVTYRICPKDGDFRWVRDQGKRIIDPVTGEPVIEGFVTNISTQIDRERELQRQQAFINQGLDAVQDLFYVLTTDGMMVRWNKQVIEVTGYTNAAISEMHASEFFVREHHARIRDSVDETLQTGSTTLQATLCTAEGERIPYEFRSTVLADPIDDTTYIVGVGRDISEQVQREAQLERMEALFREAEHLGKLGAWEFDADESITWTDGTRRIHEVEEDYSPSIPEALEFFHPKDQLKLEERMEKALVEGESYELELRLQTAKGNERWVRTRGTVLFSANPTRVRGFIQDITDQKVREQELQTTNAQLEDAFAAGAVGTWEWDIQADRVSVGQTFATTFDIDPAMAQAGVSLDRFIASIHEDDRDRVEAAITTALNDCGPYEVTYRVRNADGMRRWVLARGHVECADDGTPLRFPGVLVDITDRKEIEQELAQQNERLNEFAAVVSHDLRNPLSVIQGRLDLAAEEVSSDHVTAIEAAVDRMDRIITDLRWLAQAGEDVGDQEPIALAPVLRDAWEMVVGPDASASCTFDLDGVEVVADGDRLAQLCENLFRNALDHAGEDVTVFVGTVDDGFYIADDGPGIPVDIREDIFESGFSTHPTGTGLGLRIVEQIVSAHGWEIAVAESAVGGAKFEITTRPETE